MSKLNVCCFAKLRNEALREGNVHRMLAQAAQLCDSGVICDDASFDGTRQICEDFVKAHPTWRLMVTAPEEQAFNVELAVKQKMLDIVHQIKPDWVLWMDGDEVFDRACMTNFRTWLENTAHPSGAPAFSFHYTQFWRNTSFARIDEGFDEGWFVKLWRYTPDLVMPVADKTHCPQFPLNILQRMQDVRRAPFEQLHYGNFGKNLVWKIVQYWGGLGGVDRHLLFSGAKYRRVPASIIPDGCEVVTGPVPVPFTQREIDLIRSFQNLKRLPQWFTVCIPAYNRAKTLPRGLDSLIAQTYTRWIAIVIDDGSTDDTPQVMRKYQDMDPRIFYVRTQANRGGVAANELGMSMAVEMTEWWTRLGSDDWFAPTKLEMDAQALSSYGAVYGPYQVHRLGNLSEVCNRPVLAGVMRSRMIDGGEFCASWANCAVRCSVLRRIKEVWGHFCDPRLRNMEDFLVNVRIARESLWAWRGMIGGKLVVNPDPVPVDGFVADAFWNVNPVGASSDGSTTGNDEVLTRQILKEDIVASKKREESRPVVAKVAPAVIEPVKVDPVPDLVVEDKPVVAEVVAPVLPGPVVPIPSSTTSAWRGASVSSVDKETVYPAHFLAQEFDEIRGKKVLDYGCGGGSDVRSYLRRGNFVWFCDIIAEYVERVASDVCPDVAFGCVLVNSSPVPFENDFFDVVNIDGVLQHILDPKTVLIDLVRTLKPGGSVYMMLVNESFRASYGARDGEGLGRAVGVDYLKCYGEAEARYLLESAGLKVEYAKPWGVFSTYKATK